MISELITRVFATRDAVHVEHWLTKSYAAHVALGALYDGLIENIDAIVEAYQGAYGEIDPPKLKPAKVDDIREHLQEEHDWIEANRDQISEGSNCIGNLIDGLTGLYAKSVYLLGLK